MIHSSSFPGLKWLLRAHTPQRRIFRVCLFSIISQNYPSSLGYHRVWNEDQTRNIINSTNSAWVATLTSIYTCLVFELSETEFPKRIHLLRDSGLPQGACQSQALHIGEIRFEPQRSREGTSPCSGRTFVLANPPLPSTQACPLRSSSKDTKSLER